MSAPLKLQAGSPPARVAEQVAQVLDMLEAATAPLEMAEIMAGAGLTPRLVLRRIEDLRDCGIAISGVRIAAGRVGWRLTAHLTPDEAAAPVQAGTARNTEMVR